MREIEELEDKISSLQSTIDNLNSQLFELKKVHKEFVRVSFNPTELAKIFSEEVSFRLDKIIEILETPNSLTYYALASILIDLNRIKVASDLFLKKEIEMSQTKVLKKEALQDINVFRMLDGELEMRLQISLEQMIMLLEEIKNMSSESLGKWKEKNFKKICSELSRLFNLLGDHRDRYGCLQCKNIGKYNFCTHIKC